MEKDKVKALLSKWDHVEDLQQLAVVLFRETNGDARKLAGSYQIENGAFGRVAQTLYDDNHEFHRFLIWNIWKSNKGKIRVKCFYFILFIFYNFSN